MYLEQDATALVVVDVQGKLASLMHQRTQLYQHLGLCIQAADLLELPILWVEQYPQGLGPTVPEVRQWLGDRSPLVKNSFSCCGEPAFNQALEASGRRQIVLTGIEAHVCVYQTAVDLLARGYTVQVNQDAISSRHPDNRQLGLARMQAAGALITSSEMLLFELMRSSAHPQFRAVSALLKNM